MLKFFTAAALVAMLPAAGALANPLPTTDAGHPTFFVGLGLEFSDAAKTPDIGITGKILSSNLSNQLVVGAGATYFPLSDKPLGVDVSGGFNLTNFSVLGGYDFLRQKPELSGGFVPTETPVSTCPSGYILSGNTCIGNVSDRRLKRDIHHLANLADGMRLYAFRYLWSDDVYVGVMAQDLLANSRWRHAVLTGADGFYAVDYAALDLVMTTLEQWELHGIDAVVTGSRATTLAALAA